jgi:uroporphyrinogen decarboxylase
MTDHSHPPDPPAIANDTLLRALRREAVPYTPIWLMRQAGRYLPEYNAVRAKAGSFMALATNPALAAEVTLQPLDRFALDAAILFSDILTVPDAMGLGLSFAEGEGPRFARPVQDEAAIASLAVPDMAALRYVFDAVRAIKQALRGRVPLIGFAGSPFTLACYMVEGRSSDGFPTMRRMVHARPDLVDRLIDVNARAVRAYVREQVAAGADVIMLFDTWGGLLTASAFERWSLASMRHVLDTIPRGIPTIVFSKGAGDRLARLAASGASCVGLDWSMDLHIARRTVGDRVALQGNLDPMALVTDPSTVARAAKAVLAQAGNAPGHIFNLGHGILPATPPEHVEALVEAVHSASRTA